MDIHGSKLKRIRRTFQDFSNLLDLIRNDYDLKINKPLDEDPRFIGDDYKRIINIILSDEYLNRKISIIHRFFEISLLNFSNMEENIIKQMGIPKKSGRKKSKKFWRTIFSFLDPWLDRWFLFTNEGVGYMTRNTRKNKNFREYNYFSKNFKIELTDYDQITLKFEIRNFVLKIKKDLCMLDVVYSLLECFSNSSVLDENRYESFSKIYKKNDIDFYVNGSGERNYMTDIYEELLKAKKEVFINDWFLSPQIYLKRPIEDFQDSRLDLVLTKLAKRGVHIYMIIYREIEGTLYNNSNYTKNYLSKCHQNIHVVRHPRFYIHFWSHHEKMVIIDSKICFMGGIDLCFGRYETLRYPLKEPIKNKTFWVGQDYSNPRIYDFENVDKWENCLIDKKSDPRMPWRDIAVQLRGGIVKGMKKHFLQFWNFNNIQFDCKKSILKEIGFLKRRKKNDCKIRIYN